MKRIGNIFIILKAYFVVVTIFFCFRVLLFLSELDKAPAFSGNLMKIAAAFVMGLRFDVVVSGYLLLLPFLVLSVMYVLNRYHAAVLKGLSYLVFVLFSITFAISAADIPYFNQFFARFSMDAFQWNNSPFFVFKMIAQEPRFFWPLFPFVLFVFAFFKMQKWIFRMPGQPAWPASIVARIAISLVFTLIIFVGIRGRVQQKSPIRVGTAYFCDHALLNQLGLNPSFTLMRSYLDGLDEKNTSIALMDDQQAIRNVQGYLNISRALPESPLSRQVLSDSSAKHTYNVVVIIMESMGAAKMRRHGNVKNITPFLDSVANHGYYFNNVYTAGKHTFNGIFSTLFSFPGIYRQHPMKESGIRKYSGIAHTLKSLGYSTTYFTTHDGQFDNVEGFLRANAFDNVISQSDYPLAEVKTTLGVPDDYMFRYSIPVIDGLAKEGKPFFVTFMTASDHGPWYVPEYYQSAQKNIKDKVIEYADWSLKQFITTASTRPWFANTLFVFVADHGAPITVVYDISLDYHHTPLAFYAPGIIREPKSSDVIGGQIDIYPTIMGFLNQPYVNSTLGINLLKETRPYIYFNDDEKLGVLDKEYFLIYNSNNVVNLYKYRNADMHDYRDDEKQRLKAMEEYLKSNLQVFQYISKSGPGK